MKVNVVKHGRKTLQDSDVFSAFDSPTASPEPGVNRLLVWDSLWMNWAMLSPLPCCAPRELIMVDRTPCTMPVNSSGLRESVPAPLLSWAGGALVDGGGGAGAPGPPAGGWV